MNHDPPVAPALKLNRTRTGGECHVISAHQQAPQFVGQTPFLEEIRHACKHRRTDAEDAPEIVGAGGEEGDSWHNYTRGKRSKQLLAS